MKECPTCRRCYEDRSNFCRVDGSGLTNTIVGTALLGGRYRLERLIARGGMGAIYQATQEELARLVAVKVLNPELVNNPNAMERFRREALAIAGLKHPNIVTIYDFGSSAEGISYIAMEYLKGKSLSRVLEQETKLSLSRTLEIIAPICQALNEAHSKGIIHRDLKPDNIMLEQSGNNEIVKVVDFGLAKLKQKAEQRRITGSLVVGTFDYMSPEQCQSLDLESTSDIYSLAVVIYEMLTGQVPFRGTTKLAIIYQHINDPPRPPRAYCPDLPDEVEKVILKALSKEPTERQSSPMELYEELAIASNIASAKKNKTKAPREKTSRYARVNDIRKNLNSTLKKHLVYEHFLGRDKELNRITTEFAFIRSGRAKPIIILGDAGVGKSQLVTEFRRRIGDGTTIFLTGRFFDYLGNTPYKPLLDALTVHLRPLSTQGGLFDKIFGELTTRIRQDLNNDWGLWLEDRSKSGSLQGGPESEKYRIFEYLAQIYLKLSQYQPIVFWMDDMQWADGLSLNFLGYLLRRTLGEAVQFIFTARIQDVTQKGHPFQQWQTSVAASRNMEQLQLPGLTPGEVEQYLELVFNNIELPEGVAQRLWQETNGNPYFLSEILRLLVEEDRIVWTGQRWQCEPLTEISMPSSIVNIVDAHLKRFREAELDIFMQASVLGEQFSFESLKLITGLGEDQLLDIVEIGLVGYVFKEQSNARAAVNAEELYRFYHTTVRKVLYGKINNRRRRRLHQRVAETLEQSQRDHPEKVASLLAYHYYQGEQYPLALKYSVEAALASWRTLAIEETENFLQRIEELLAKIEEAQQLEQQAQNSQGEITANNVTLALSLAQYRTLCGEVLTVRGRFPEAERALFTALKLSDLSSDVNIAGRAILATGILYKERNEHDRAIKFFQKALIVYQKSGDRAGECQALNNIAGVNYEQAIYGQASEYANRCLTLAKTIKDQLAEAAATLIMGATDLRIARYERSLEASRRSLALAQTLGDRILERQAASLLGNAYSILGNYSQATTWLNQALEMARDTGARKGEAHILVNLGEVYRRQGQFQEAIDYLSQAYDFAVQIRALKEQEMALLSLSFVYKGLNYQDRAQSYLNQAIALNKDVRDPVLIIEEECALAELILLNNELPQALALVEKAVETTRQTGLRAQQWQILNIQARILRAQKQSKALEVAQESYNILKKICGEITDEATRKTFLSDKNYVLQLVNQLKNANF